MFSKTMEYALRAAYCLARSPEEHKTTKRIAREMKIPPSYLAKIMQNLTRAGIVKSRRGVSGGFMLERPPQDITMLDVVNAVDPIERYESCPLGFEHEGGELCSLHSRIQAAFVHVEEAFQSYSLSELCSDDS